MKVKEEREEIKKVSMAAQGFTEKHSTCPPESWSLGFSKVRPHSDSLPREVWPAHHQPKLHQKRWIIFAADIKTLSVLQWKFYNTLTIHFRHHRSMKVDGGDQWPLVSEAAAEWLGEEEEEPLAQTWPHQCNTKLESWWYQSWRLVLAAQIY